MINEFWNLVLEIWQQGIRGIGIDNIISSKIEQIP